ncbi:MAG: PIN domain-containing protein [Bifidobacteriaceae bacterium]|jgi:predicted nucleic acid-binding protein|nr:PIN domain-containing protein [Bifidobacteriaceae bacterium]
MIMDTSALLAFFDASDRNSAAVADVVGAAQEPLVAPPFVVAELDYLVLTSRGRRAEQAVADSLASGAWRLAPFGLDLMAQAARCLRQYGDHQIGLTDASIMVLAQATGPKRVATFDRRHFAFLRFEDGSAPELLPAA